MPHSVLKSKESCGLSFSAFKLLVYVCLQYNGKNNGALVASLSYFKKYGWNSNSTITKGLKELKESGLIIQTRQGMRVPWSTTSLFALSWLDLDNKTDLDFDPRNYERRKLTPKEIITPRKINNQFI